MSRPLILVTNDDGADSDGLWAAVEALHTLGDILVVAPDRQWSGAGRSMPHTVTGAFTQTTRETSSGAQIPVYAIDASPALCVGHAMIEFVAQKPALVVAGINFGENISMEVTISGTLGAALEGAAYGIPGMAISLEMSVPDHLTGGTATDYTAAQAFTYHFAQLLLRRALPYDVDVLNVNVPKSATPDTPWRLTRISRQRYFLPVAPNRENGNGRPGYRVMKDPSRTEKDSDIYALRVDRVVAVTPISMDMTSRNDFGLIEEQLRTDW